MSYILGRIINLSERLRDSNLVSRFQKYFGVHLINVARNDAPDANDLRVADRTIKCRNILTSLNVSKEEHRQNSSPSTSDLDDMPSESSDQEAAVQYLITSRFWYYVFSFGAGLGYEMFYASFFPFWIWNIDGAVCRRVVVLWALIMYVGQAMKDIIRWPRPSTPPVVHLEPRYVNEYGMPSTHAMVGAAVPFSLLFFTMHRYEYPFIIGLLIAVVWCTLVCCSRLYMGMHTISDIIGGLVLVALLMLVIIPFSDELDNFLLTNPYSPLVTVAIMILLLSVYPNSRDWTPARGDTAVIMGTCAGFAIGSWLNYRLGVIRGPGLPPPYKILWPDYGVIGLALLRAIIGILCIVATRAFFKTITYAILCYLLRLDANDLRSRQKTIVEVPYKFITYTAIGFVITYIAPCVFRLLNIERVTMFTEV